MIAGLTQPLPTRWPFLGGWTLAFIGFPLGGLAAFTLLGAMNTPFNGLIGGLIAGACLGLTQGLALRQPRPFLFRWILVTALGMGLGFSLSLLLLGAATDSAGILGRALITGAALGVAQAVGLRLSFGWSLAWALLITVMYTVAWWVTSLVIQDSVNLGWVTFGSSGAILYQFVTGLALLYLSPRQNA